MLWCPGVALKVMWAPHRGRSVILTFLVLTFFTKSACLALNFGLIPHDCRLSARFPSNARGKPNNRPSSTLKATRLQYYRASLCAPLMSEIEQPVNVSPSNASDRITTMYQFARPHTIHGTILASVMVVLRALSELRSLPAIVEGGRLSMFFRFLPKFLVGVLSLLLGNVFIVGVNQIFDVKIDRINKPFLPMASGRLTNGMACSVVAFSGVVGSILVATYFSKLIFGLYICGLVFGGLYSAPPIRLKRYPVLAAIIIAFVRGFLLHFGIHSSVAQALDQPIVWSPPLIFMCRYMSVFAGVIAVTKDLPDVDGDEAYNVNTVASQYGVGRAALAATVVLGLNYISAIVESMAHPAGAFNRCVMTAGHVAGLMYLIRSFRHLNATTKEMKES